MKKISVFALAFFAIFALASFGFAYDLTGNGYGAVQKARPSIAFVLTTWEKKGAEVTTEVTHSESEETVSESSAEAIPNQRTPGQTLCCTRHRKIQLQKNVFS